MRIDISGVIVANDDKWIYEYFGYEATSPDDVIGKIGQTNPGETVDVYINSGGGDVFAGSAIYSALSEAPNVAIHVVGIAASAASVIMCAGPSDIERTAMVMVHNVASGADGDYRVMDKESEILQAANKSIAAAYVAKSGMTEEDALAMMDNETWLTAAAAVEKGLVDRIRGESIQLTASYGPPMLPRSVIDKIKNELHPQEQKAQADFLMLEKERLNLMKIKGVRQ